MAEDVGTVVNKIENIDSKIKSLTTEKEELTKANYKALLEHDLETIDKAEDLLANLKTNKANSYIEEAEVFEVLSDVTYNIRKDLGIED